MAASTHGPAGAAGTPVEIIVKLTNQNLLRFFLRHWLRLNPPPDGSAMQMGKYKRTNPPSDRKILQQPKIEGSCRRNAEIHKGLVRGISQPPNLEWTSKARGYNGIKSIQLRREHHGEKWQFKKRPPSQTDGGSIRRITPADVTILVKMARMGKWVAS